MIRSARCWAAVAAVMMAGLAAPAWAQTPLGTQFTYQGQLSQLGNAASGTYDLRFRLYDDATAGDQNGPEICVPNVSVLNGLVTVPLDFGNVMLGQNLWLEIDVRVSTGAGCGDTSGYERLAPRQQLTAAPYSIFSLSAGSAATASNAQAIGGQPASNVALLSGAQIFTGPKSFTSVGNTFVGVGAGLLDLNASNISTGTLGVGRLPTAVARTDQPNAFGNFTNTFGGRVGMGVVNPAAALHVVGGPVFNQTRIESGEVLGTWLNLGNTGTSGRTWSLVSTGGGNTEGVGRLLIRDQVAGAVRMIFDTSGNVGIGTSTPDTPLRVAGDRAAPVLRVTNQSALGGGSINAGESAAIEGLITSATGPLTAAVRGAVTGSGLNGVGVAALHEGTGIALFAETRGTDGWTLYASSAAPTGSGKAIIGTTSSPTGYSGYFSGGRTYVSNSLGVGALEPAAQLHVAGGPANSTALFDSGLTAGTWLNLGNTSTGGRRWNLISTGSANDEGAGKLLIRDNNAVAVRMAIDPAGNVGIGTTAPSARLEVAGSSPAAVLLARNASTAGGGSFLSGISAVLGEISAPTAVDFAAAVRGRVLATVANSSAGVLGINAGSGYGVFGQTAAVGGVGVYGNALSASGTTYGVIGFSNSPSGYGGYFFGGRTFISTLGVNTASPTNQLTVNGNANITGNLSKGGGSFKIDHPLDPANKYLYHSFVESPDMLNIYNGNATTDERGYATIELPDYFQALNRDFRYQLTVLDDEDTEEFVQAKVVRRIEGNRFTIRTSAPNVHVSWLVTGVRQDAWAERNRIPTTVEKSPEERGLYLHPEAFDLPENKAIFRKPEQHPMPMSEGTPR